MNQINGNFNSDRDRDPHNRGFQSVKARSFSPGGHGRVEWEAWMDRREAEILR